MDCKACKERFRADKIIEDYMAEHGVTIEGSVDAWSCLLYTSTNQFNEAKYGNLTFNSIFQGKNKNNQIKSEVTR